MAPGSGGWSFPRPGRDQAVLDTLPPIQLYNIFSDPGETQNLHDARPDIVDQLKRLLIRQIEDGRSTPGVKQANDEIDFEWKQVQFTKN